jgi:curved DNA-binding protein CbpA
VAHYDVLGVPFDADTETIHRAYRRLARKYHPDAGAGSSSEKFLALTEAYRTLSNPHLRAAYDEQLRRSNRPEPEPLIPEGHGFSIAWRRRREPTLAFEFPDYLFAELEQIAERMFEDFEKLFSLGDFAAD